jgi:hypothetical protein
MCACFFASPQTAVTKRKEEEQSSSSVFNQALPGAPVVDFSTYINPNESIRNEDLVLWVSSGIFHYPGAEDNPVTPTTGSLMGFILRPFNFFNESAAISLPDVVRVPGQVSPELAKNITGNASATGADIGQIVAALQPFRGTQAAQVDTCMPSVVAPPFVPMAMPTEEAIRTVQQILAAAEAPEADAAAAPSSGEGAPSAGEDAAVSRGEEQQAAAAPAPTVAG